MKLYNRACLYLNLGFSAARVAELIGYPLAKVQNMKESGEFVPITKRDRAVHLVLRGVSIPEAAEVVHLPVAQVEKAVEDARYKIDQLVAAQYPHNQIAERR